MHLVSQIGACAAPIIPVIKTLLRSDPGPAIERMARLLAVAIAVCFTAGFVCGREIHRLNDMLAGLVTGPAPALARTPVASVPVAPAPVVPAPVASVPVAPVPLAPVPLAPVPVALDSHTVKQLRHLARQRGYKQLGGQRIAQCRKAQLVEALA